MKDESFWGIPRCVFALLVSVGLQSGCGVTVGAYRLAAGEWHDQRTLRSERGPEPTPTRTVAATLALTTPPQVSCQTRLDVPPTRITDYAENLSLESRLGMWTLGSAEVLAGALGLGLGDDLSLGAQIGLGALVTDGLLAVILAAVVPGETVRHRQTPARTEARLDCGDHVAFLVQDQRIAVDPAGNLPSTDARTVMIAALTGAPTLTLLLDEEAEVHPVPAEVRCAWARALHHPSEPLHCLPAKPPAPR